jgi:hypothetical protein
VASPENEQSLVELARTSTAAQLEQACRLMRLRDPVERVDDRRWLRVKECDDGTLLLQVKVTADEAELILRACEVSLETARPSLGDVLLDGDPEAELGQSTEVMPT